MTAPLDRLETASAMALFGAVVLRGIRPTPYLADMFALFGHIVTATVASPGPDTGALIAALVGGYGLLDVAGYIPEPAPEEGETDG